MCSLACSLAWMLAWMLASAIEKQSISISSMSSEDEIKKEMKDEQGNVCVVEVGT